MVNGFFQGFGTYIWPLSKTPDEHKEKNLRFVYSGNWIQGRMHGQGEFTHTCGTIYKGNFANNLYVCVVKGIKYLISPFEDP